MDRSNKIKFCIFIVAGVTLLVLSSIFIFKTYKTNTLKGDIYEQSLKYINLDEAVQAHIGTPVTPSIFIDGIREDKGEKGQIKLQFKVHGEKGSGFVNVYAYKEKNLWVLFEVIVNTVESKERIHVYSPRWKPRHNEKLLNN